MSPFKYVQLVIFVPCSIYYFCLSKATEYFFVLHEATVLLNQATMDVAEVARIV